MVKATPPEILPEDQNVGPTLLVLSGILLFFVALSTSLRVYVRYKNHMLGWDDYTISLVTVIAFVRVGTEIAQSQHGNGRHRWFLADEDYVASNMWGWYGQLLLFAGVCLLKISICLLILRIKNDPWLKILLRCVMAGLVVTNGGVIIILLAECSPVEAYWTGQPNACWDNRVRIYSIYFTIAYSILTDLLCSLLPLAVIWKVRMPLRTKMLVWLLMSLGLLATGFGIARAASLGIITVDLTWVYCISAIWSNCELFLGIIAANLALSMSIYAYFFGEQRQGTTRVYSSSGGKSGRSGRSGGLAPADLRNDTIALTETVVEGHERRLSETRSEETQTSAELGIHKTTEFWLEEGSKR
ncbi:hypothetical protein GQ53DRAFT_527772 [Thozetella sp. PMI_491]|nr:hypothetical protein GQ53DRAFT_527772 [Thozetella sp. PMI_491]